MLVRLGVPEVLPLLEAPLDGQGALAAEAGGQRWNRAGPVGRFGMAPRTALVAAGLLAAALEVAAAESESELETRLMPLAAAARMRWKERRPGLLTRVALPSVFTAALDAVLGEQARRQ
ncbi:unnamed protein product [[Actinomadura] parvosata subsp. kistnae]|nr:unnamed protein product [Actinomadura parvosata subsp. kistnae]